eukprot:2069899-Pyramimonas_sp.AAC.1
MFRIVRRLCILLAIFPSSKLPSVTSLADSVSCGADFGGTPRCLGARVPRCPSAQVPGCTGAQVLGCLGARQP